MPHYKHSLESELPNRQRCMTVQCRQTAIRDYQQPKRHSERSEESGLGRRLTQILRCAQNDDLFRVVLPLIPIRPRDGVR
jgi:hypothetical protein